MPTLVYRFQGAGADSVKSEIRDIDRATAKSAATQARQDKKLRRGRARARLKRIRQAKRDAASEQRLVSRTANRQAKAHESAAKKTARIQAKSHQKQIRARQRQLKETEKQLRKERDMFTRHQKQQASRQARGRKRRAGQVGAVGRGLFGLAGGAAAAVIGGTALLSTAAARQQITLEDKSRSLAIQGRSAGQKAADPRQITRDAQKVALRVGGTTAESVIDAMTTFVTRTGKFEVAQAMAETFAVTAKATGASADDIAGAAADLFEKFDITKIDDMRDALAALTFQGKEGAFELADAASQFPKLAAAAQRLGIGKGVEAVRTLGGLTQISRKSTGSAEAAATSLEALFTGLTTKQAELGKAGVTVFDKKTGQAADIVPLLAEVIAKVGGEDIGKKKSELAKIFGRQGIRALSPLIDEYTKALLDGKDGQEAVTNALNKSIDAPGTWSDVLDDAALANETISSQLISSWEAIVAASGDTLVPAITDLAGVLSNFMTELGGIEAVGFIFDVVGENVGAFGDLLRLAGKGLEVLGLVKGPTSQQRINDEKELQDKLIQSTEAKVKAQKRIGKRIAEGRATKEDVERFIQLGKESQEFAEKRIASEKRQTAFEDVEAKKNERIASVGTQVERKVTDPETFISGQQFTDAFIAEMDVSDFERGFLQLAAPGTSPELIAAAESKLLLTAIQRGENVPTLGYSEGQQALITKASAQAQALRSGIGVEEAPADAFGLTSEQIGAKLAPMTDAANNASGALNALAATARADVGG